MSPITRAEGFGLEVVATDGRARRSRLQTPHGVIETPTFMPVATYGAVRGISNSGAQWTMHAPPLCQRTYGENGERTVSSPPTSQGHQKIRIKTLTPIKTPTNTTKKTYKKQVVLIVFMV